MSKKDIDTHEGSEEGFLKNEEWFQRLLKYERIRKLPDHLKQYIVDQNHAGYTPVDHAVWRYVMRKSRDFLKDNAHDVYLEGLAKTGLKVDAIPSIEEMNDILSKIGWAAVPVDGFIPPAAFMEFQAHRVLVIAADMRQIHHIEYTPSPDIIHEAAGHAPIIADPEYAEYLRLFGEVGSKAMSSKKDFELYEAIRKLSILKEAPDVPQDQIDAAEKDVLEKQENLGEPSEMALLTRLHWWTVEFGLVGDIEKPKIYGAGLLSSIGESENCLTDAVKKLPYSLETKNYAFDITTQQPHLFVTPDFQYLTDVLNEFSRSMAFKTGGYYGLTKAIECENTCTAQYSSGLQVSGTFNNVLTDENRNPVYLWTDSPTALAFAKNQLEGHGKDYHADGFSSPVGLLKDAPTPLEDLSDQDLKQLGIETGKDVTLTFQSGVQVKGKLEKILRQDNHIVLMTFTRCTVTYGDKTMFEPAWGIYDMAVGASITSVYSGAADKDAFEQPAMVSRTRTIKVDYKDNIRLLHRLYQAVRDHREKKSCTEILEDTWDQLKQDYPGEWLLPMEILELLEKNNQSPDMANEIKHHLLALAEEKKEYRKLITDGLNLVAH